MIPPQAAFSITCIIADELKGLMIFGKLWAPNHGTLLYYLDVERCARDNDQRNTLIILGFQASILLSNRRLEHRCQC